MSITTLASGCTCTLKILFRIQKLEPKFHLRRAYKSLVSDRRHKRIEVPLKVRGEEYSGGMSRFVFKGNTGAPYQGV